MNTNQEQDVVVGIDLGTTNSLISYCKDGVPVIIKDNVGRYFEPSVVQHDYDSNKFLVGHEAINKNDAIYSVKKFMGQTNTTNNNFEYVNNYLKNDELRKHDSALNPVQISSEILKKLKNRAERHLNTSVTKAVITVPAYFDEIARSNTRIASELAGIKVLRLINEPTAAAYSYGINFKKNGIFAFYDLGGGTFDFTILKSQKGVLKVISTAGDLNLGGDDIDKTFLSYIVNNISDKISLRDAKIIKEQLSNEESINFKNNTFNREDLDRISYPFIRKSIKICSNVCIDAGIYPRDINDIVLVGGASRMHIVRKEIRDLFEKQPIIKYNPDQIVVMGAALKANSLSKRKGSILVDVTPLSLGVETIGGNVEKIIYKNTSIPISYSQVFTTQQDNQTSILFNVVQGEQDMAFNCKSLARFELNGIRKEKAGKCHIIVTFSIDSNGLLHVEAKDKNTSNFYEIDIEPLYNLNQTELASLLKETNYYTSQEIEQHLLFLSRQKGQEVLSETREYIDNNDINLNMEHIKIKTGLLRRGIKLNNRLLIENLIKSIYKATNIPTHKDRYVL